MYTLLLAAVGAALLPVRPGLAEATCVFPAFYAHVMLRCRAATQTALLERRLDSLGCNSGTLRARSVVTGCAHHHLRLGFGYCHLSSARVPYTTLVLRPYTT